MEERDARIHGGVQKIGRPTRVGANPDGPTRSRICPSANTTASANPWVQAGPGQSKEEAPAGADFCSCWRGRHCQLQESGGRTGDRQADRANPRDGLCRRRPGLRKGSAEDFKNCYDPAWGRFKDRTKPALGNHEYVDPTAPGYFQYWGLAAGLPGKGYYAYDLGDWHVVVLNTNCDAKDLGGCAAGSPQEAWLKGDLAKHPNACVLAYGHHALFSSGVFKKHALHPELKQLWGDL